MSLSKSISESQMADRQQALDNSMILVESRRALMALVDTASLSQGLVLGFENPMMSLLVDASLSQGLALSPRHQLQPEF